MGSANLVQLIKKISMDAVNAGKPCDYRTGVVTRVDPLHIKVSNSLVLEEEFLRLARNVTDYEVEIKLDGTVKKCQIKNGLKKGEKVLMMRKAGGQEFAVIDRVVS